VQSEFLAVRAVRTLVRLIALSSDREVRAGAVIGSVSLLFGGNDDVQREFFREMKILKDVNVYKVLFDIIEAAAASKVDNMKEVGLTRRMPFACVLAVPSVPPHGAWNILGCPRACPVVFDCTQCCLVPRGRNDQVKLNRSRGIQDGDCLGQRDITFELKLLQLLCEGHVLKRQDTLRIQGKSGKSYDLVTAVARYFVTLEACADEAGLREALQAINTMIDMMQGPCMGNILAVIDAKVVEACKRLLAWTDNDLMVMARCSRPASLLLLLLLLQLLLLLLSSPLLLLLLLLFW
jgi:hypothetical protein